MADSDEDFVLSSSGDDRPKARGAGGGGGGGSGAAGSSRRSTRKSKRADGAPAPGATKREKWEDIQRSWDNVVEGADGSIAGTVIGLLEATKRKRLLRDTTPIQRGIIRHLVLILDLSSAMLEKDLRPTRFLLTLRYARDFVTEYFEQNPISQLSIIGMHDGLALRISDMGGNPADHLTALQEKAFTVEPKGASSLQNALEMGRAELFHTPTHGTREILLIFGALSSSDPGDIHDTINSLIEDRIQVRIVGLAAQVAVCRELVMKTNDGDDSAYGVILDESHYRELMMAATTPPVTKTEEKSVPSLLMMGFPSRTVEKHESFCSCHSNLTKGGYICPRCTAKVCFLPTECPCCGLTLILSTHLARSYHHLFPLKNWVEVPWSEAHTSTHCWSCQSPFPTNQSQTSPIKIKIRKPSTTATTTATTTTATASKSNGATTTTTTTSTAPENDQPPQPPTQRYACTDCKTHFCIDCDIFAHESLHNCPGCQSLSEERVKARANMWPPSTGDGTADAAGEPISLNMRTQVAEATKMLENSKIAPGSSMEVDS
ncbi:hypothetical protein TWF192_003374 [Orbilia oligospora]|uniref:Uncharacterized protein n=1 Tax=Orbilia oligospora TaxID=2813651 RepID=A0A6G1LRA9_ORBOL|nr:hypothetical protein TWF191_003504 [Orbilia oligospora]KAF3231785.1 hypothetical protein TWF192_003374 [Orbilia oligospora]